MYVCVMSAKPADNLYFLSSSLASKLMFNVLARHTHRCLGRTRSRMAGWVSHALFPVCFEPVTAGIAWSSELVGDRQSPAPLTANERPHTLDPNQTNDRKHSVQTLNRGQRDTEILVKP